MAINYDSASVTYTFIDPNDPKAVKKNHILNGLTEHPDEAKLLALGEEFKALLPKLTLSAITVSTDSIVTADAAPATDTPAPTTDTTGAPADPNATGGK